MDRTQARQYLKALHPLMLQHGILHELLGGVSLESRAEFVSSVAGFERVRDLDNLEMLRDDLLKAVGRVETALETDVVRRINQVEVAELLASEIPDVRILAVRLAGERTA